jgi:citrate-Mg2+:H+ or citrate-Ca2+:H+ symporter, CitMHS family
MGDCALLMLLGYAMIVTFMVLIMTKRLSPMVALTLVPVIFALVAGFSHDAIGEMMIDGVKKLAPTGVMLMFAILYFGVMIDAGLFDPAVRLIVRIAGNDPLKIVLGTAILAAFVSLDGDGSTTYMITVAAMLPLYQRLGMSALNLTCVTMLAGGVMNMTPWGGPLARAASALHVEPNDIFVPMLPAMAAGVAGVMVLAYILGMQERRRLGKLTVGDLNDGFVNDGLMEGIALIGDTDTHKESARPNLLWINASLTLALMVALVSELLPIAVLFMLGFAIALLINYPKMEEQRRRVASHAGNVVAVVSIIFAAGIFTGILNGTGMVEAMSRGFLAAIPESWGPYLAPITALVSMPFTFFMSNDAFYFGALPIISEAAGHYGIAPAEMARASLVGQPVHLLSPLVPSTYLLVGLAGVEFGDHQRFTIRWAVLISLLIGAAAMLCSAFPMTA